MAVFFMLLGFKSVKAVRKMLMKLTLGIQCGISTALVLYSYKSPNFNN